MGKLTIGNKSPIQTALQYIANGWPVFPCRAAEEADQRTGEIYGAKTPLTPNGFKDASKFQHIAERRWSDYPDAAIGIPTGPLTGVFVLDIDQKPGGANGFEWLADMEAEHGPLPPTRRATTPNNGLHIYFKHVDGVRNRGGLGAGTDLRGEGGYVLAPGSIMGDGRAYVWENANADILDAPDWLLELLLRQPVTAPSAPYQHREISNQPYVERAVQDELSELSSAPSGGRNNSLNDAAFALGQFVGAGAISRAVAEQELREIARPWGNFAKSCGTIKSGLDAGIKQPRAIPEPTQDNTSLVDVSGMISRGLAKARKQHENTEREDISPPGDNNTERDADSIHATKPANDNEPSPILVATPFKWIDPKTLPRRDFAFGKHYIRKYVSVTVAPGGLGKTANSIVESLSMTSGKALAGVKPAKPLHVWVFNAEDPRDELDRRIMAACIHYNLKPDDLHGRLFLDTGREQELVIAREDKKAGVKIVEPIVEAIVSLISANNIDVMIVDPFVSTHAVNENDNGAIDKVAKLWAQIADRTNCAIDIVHHLRKVSDREATIEDSRGAVSLIGAARSVRVLNRMTPDQAKEALVSGEERNGMFSITYGKSNLTPLSSKVDWRKLESVALGNGGRGNLGVILQDKAPVVTEWHWPSAEDAANEVPDDNLAVIKARVRGSDYVANYQSEMWVGRLVADVLGIELASGKAKSADHKRIEKMISVWIEQGHLRQEKVKGIDIKHPERMQLMVRA